MKQRDTRVPTWRPTASMELLRARAAALATVRQFFAMRGVLEVDTPQVVNHAVTDVHLQSGAVRWPTTRTGDHFLHTSPEYAMKRLLAAGSGDIYQLCHVFRGEELGSLHNSEFMMLEWYRVGWPLARLMAEVDELVRALLRPAAATATTHVSYEQALVTALGCNPLDDPLDRLAQCARAQGCDAVLVARCSRDELLDLLMGTCVGPRLGAAGPQFVHRYPASQAALARLDPADARVALRFELYLDGIELANGFEELADADEQRARFEADLRERAVRGLGVLVPDEFLLAALRSGMPACSGVALGFDRLLMLASGAQHIAEVLPFTADNA